jgi:hypothetical protein
LNTVEKLTAEPFAGEPPEADQERDVTLPLIDGLHVTVRSRCTEDVQPSALMDGAGGGVRLTDCDFELHADPLHALSVMVLLPVLLKFVEKLVPLPLDGEPPDAVQDREVIAPLVEGLQVNDCPVWAEPGHPSELIVGALAASTPKGMTEKTANPTKASAIAAAYRPRRKKRLKLLKMFAKMTTPLRHASLK